MGQQSPLRQQPEIVRAPRVSDAVGASLRDAYARDRRLPDDMMVLLARLNGNGGMRAS